MTRPPPPPIAMLAEVTHRCPLACPYCSNPVEMTTRDHELDTQAWADIFRQAADLGVLQLHLSGGEPGARRDLADLVQAARAVDLYVNLITSGIGFTQARLHDIIDAGTEHVQLSLQGTNADMADWVGGYRGGYERKLQFAKWVSETDVPLTLNAVMHRHNLDQLPETIEMAHTMGARRIEIACVQFQGWALKNRRHLQPDAEQVKRAKAVVAQARAVLQGQLVIDFVPPDYFADYPKACMGGWGSTGLNIAPDGKVLPCHAAETIPNLTFQTVQDASLRDIWYDDPAFNAFRGTDWMPDLCQTCERRDIDYGGCRCQATAIAGNPAATDPVCRKSPDRPKVDRLLSQETQDGEWSYRRFTR